MWAGRMDLTRRPGGLRRACQGAVRTCSLDRAAGPGPSGARPRSGQEGDVVLVDEARRAGDTVLLAEHRHEPRAPRLSKFHAPEIVFGPHSLAEAAHAAVRLGARRPFVVTDPGLMSAGWPSELLDELRG